MNGLKEALNFLAGEKRHIVFRQKRTPLLANGIFTPSPNDVLTKEEITLNKLHDVPNDRGYRQEELLSYLKLLQNLSVNDVPKYYLKQKLDEQRIKTLDDNPLPEAINGDLLLPEKVDKFIKAYQIIYNHWTLLKNRNKSFLNSTQCTMDEIQSSQALFSYKTFTSTEANDKHVILDLTRNLITIENESLKAKRRTPSKKLFLNL